MITVKQLKKQLNACIKSGICKDDDYVVLVGNGGFSPVLLTNTIAPILKIDIDKMNFKQSVFINFMNVEEIPIEKLDRI